MIDIHSHILPGLDDGAKNESEFIDALQIAKRQNITEIICTPHFYPPAIHSFIVQEKGQSICSSKEQVLDVFRRMSPIAESLGIKLYTGMECFYHSSLPEHIEAGEVLPLAGSRYLLVEFEQNATFVEIKRGLISIIDIGYLPVLAHYERYPSMTSRERLKELKELGACLQMNFDTVQRYYGWRLKRNGFRDDLKAGIVDFMGSDCHGIHFRPLRIIPSVEWMRNQLQHADQILVDNPRKIIINTI